MNKQSHDAELCSRTNTHTHTHFRVKVQFLSEAAYSYKRQKLREGKETSIYKTP